MYPLANGHLYLIMTPEIIGLHLKTIVFLLVLRIFMLNINVFPTVVYEKNFLFIIKLQAIYSYITLCSPYDHSGPF